MIKKNLRLFVTLSIIGYLFYFLYENKSYINFSSYKTNYLFIIFLVFVIKHSLQGLINQILYSNIDIKIKLVDALFATIINSLGNIFGPLNLGLGLKFAYFKNKFKFKNSDFIKVSIDYAVFHLFYTIGIFLLVLIYLDRNQYSEYVNIFTFLFFGLFLVILSSNKIVNFINDSGLNPKIKQIFSIINFNSIKRNRFKLFISANFHYIFTFLTIYLTFNFLNIDNTFFDAINFAVIGEISSFYRITPGNIGIIEIALIFFKDLLSLTTIQIILISITQRLLSLLSLGFINLTLGLFFKVSD
tara:strand:+ start:174 stop:1076 length:903 start_codon:yes stop_codon:yes gene_type:complete